MIDLRAAFAMPPEQALQYILGKKLALKFDYKRLEAEAKERSFWVTGITKLDTLQVFHNAIAQALRDGTDFQRFRDRVVADLMPLVRGASANRLPGVPSDVIRTPRMRTIYETNIQSAYMAGRYKGLTKLKQLLPYWRFDSIIDKRSSPVCPPLDGIVVRANDPFWNTHTPPLHFNCRSNITALSETDIELDGIKPLTSVQAAEMAQMHPAAAGFNHNPATSRYTPEQSNYNPELYKSFMAEQKRRGN